MRQWILHSWDDKNCLKILRNCYEALPDHGKVIVVDVVNTETTATTNADKSLSQLYLVLTNINQGGKERTERELESLAKEAGFSGVKVACRAFDFSVVELYKNM
jgi:caffeic acid 3-O-methyltransferase